ncbi:MAG: four helix bundle protein [Planctomycetota bacterium]|jgi:four helix bundle protein
MAGGVTNFKDLKIWKVAIELVKKVYMVSSKLPKEERYGLTSQMRRCAVSIPSNVAEGFRRQHNKEFKQFLYISLGSCAELETQMITANELRYVDKDQMSQLCEDLDHVCRMTSKLMRTL